MRTKNFTNFFAAALFVVACTAAASAQVITASGTITLKQADGTAAPVQGASVRFVRTDIKQEFTAKTDKKGHYVNVGLPIQGTYTLIISAPGAAPTYIAGVKLNAKPENDFTLDPGNGSTITLEQIKAANVGAATTGTATASGGTAAPAAPKLSPEEAKKRDAEIAAERARVEAQNARATELNAKLPQIIKAGNDAFNAKNYDEAIARYDEGIQADAEQPSFFANKSVALRSRGVDKYNVAVKAKDQPGKEAARNDFKASAETAEKAVTVFRANAAKSKTAAAPGAQGQTEELTYLNQRSESYRIALQTSTQIDTEAAVKAMQEYVNAEPDPAKKAKAQAGLGDALYAGGKVDEAVAKFREILATNPGNLDAMFGLGIALASTDPPKLQEAHDMLAQFVAKAPEGYPRKADALESVKYLEDTMKTAAIKPDEGRAKKPAARRKP